MIYTTTIKETVDGDAYIELSPELLSTMGWDETTVLVWVEQDGKIYIKEKK